MDKAVHETEELKKKTEEWRKKNEEFRRQVEERSVLKYFEEGRSLPCLTICGDVCGPSTPNKHEPIAIKIVKNFGVVDIQPEDVAHCATQTTDIICSEWFYSSKLSVQDSVRKVLSDMIYAAKLGKELWVSGELDLLEVRAERLIASSNDPPLAVVVVRSPSKINKRSWDVNYGRLYDYLLRIRSFHGVKNVIGLFTNWNEWVFGWLEDCDISATATDLHYELNNEVTFSTPTPERKLHVSRKYCRHDLKSLAEALFSWLKKLARNATGRSVAPVPWLHPDRSYIKLTADKWVWQRGLPITELSLWPPPKNSQSFYLLHDFGAGRDGHAWLACHLEKRIMGGPKGRLAVLKFPERGSGEGERAREEVSSWHKPGVASVYSTRLWGRRVIVMPLGFHYNSERTINSTWWSPPNDNPPIKDFSRVVALVSSCVPEDVLDACIEKCAAKKLVHPDIEWRHVAIFPKRIHQPSTDTSTIELEYGFIDLTAMKEQTSEEAAKAVMMRSKQEMLDP